MKTLPECLELKQTLMAKFAARFPEQAARPEVQAAFNCRIIFNDRMRTSLGRARYSQNSIELNSRVLGDNPDKFDSTFAHEVAHLVAKAAFGRLGGGHGRGWKATMRALGYEPERTHKIDCSALARPHAVLAQAKCGCRTFEIKPRRYKAMQNGAKYRCSYCGQRLEIVPNATIELDKE